MALATSACTASADAPSTHAAVHLKVVKLVDASRRAHFRNGTTGPRVLVTSVRYPVRGRPPFPLIVFVHGFALSPATYALLLDTWARADYVVAAPAFPVESAGAPGGPDRSDLLNEPADIRFVIARLTALRGPWSGLVDPHEIAVAGQSDGAVAALAAAYDARFADRRIDAAVILSGAAPAGFARPVLQAPPLLAVQGTADTINPPIDTTSYYSVMRRPKFLLWLDGASHLAPYTAADRWAKVVDRATIAFLDHYLRGAPLRPLLEAGTRPGTARIVANQ